MDLNNIKDICSHFDITGTFLSAEVLKGGHINGTYRVTYDRDGRIVTYVLQSVNTYVFKDPVALSENVSNVTEYIRARIKSEGRTAKRSVLHFMKRGEDYYYCDDTGFWRCYRYIDDSVCYDTVDDMEIIAGAGRAFGEFQLYLADYPADTLHIPIPDFHHTPRRFLTFDKAISDDFSGRLSQVAPEVEGFMVLRDEACRMQQMHEDGLLPLRVTHNDTKLNNVLFDDTTGEPLTVIDLDTIMPGLVAFDFGDAIRFLGNTCAEDEPDASLVKLDIDKFEAFTRGFVTALHGSLTPAEIDTLALGALTMTVECGIRFLSDFLDGDKYFRVEYPEHNLVRARTQLALARDMLLHMDEMHQIVRRYAAA